MELTIEELGSPQEKKAITYDDILAQMNMQIVNGCLQYIAPIANGRSIANGRPQHNAPIANGRPQHNAPIANGHPQRNAHRKSPKTEEMYNKYFEKKIERPAALIFKTQEDYRRHMIKKVVEARVARVKTGRSTKLFFYNRPHYSGAQTYNNQLVAFKKKGITL